MQYRIKLWDTPTRLFHWSLVLLFGVMWWSGETGGDALRLHLLAGYGIAGLLLFRLLWGVLGSDTARFARFVRGPGAMLASVTSADDEFAFSLAQLPWPSEEVCPHVLALTRPDGSTIFLLNRGEAVNFVHGAVIGEYVYLVLAEIIEGVHQLAHQASTPGLHELPQATMQRIARHWLTDFHGVTP